MNKPAPITVREYLAHLPLSEEQRAELSGSRSLLEVHRRLAAQPVADNQGAVQASVAQRLTLLSTDAQMLDSDGEGRVRLKATPPIRRTRVLP